MASFLPYLSDHRNKDKTHTLFIRITTYMQTAKVSTDLRIAPIHWNDKKKEVRVSHHDYDGLNKALKSISDKLSKIYTDAKGNGVSLNAGEIKILYEERKGAGTAPPAKGGIDLFEFAEDYFKKLEAAGKWNTVNSRRAIFSKFKAWLGQDSIQFEQITAQLLENYKIYLMGKNAKSTVHVNFKRIKEQFNRANKLGVYPGAFPFVQLEKGKVKRDKLTAAEVKKIEDAELTGYLNDVRNFWLFSFYCAGIRFSDLCLISHKMISKGRLKYAMAKTDHTPDRKLHPKAIDIIKQYPGSGFIFPIIDSSWYGKKLTPEKSNELRRHIASRNTLVNAALKEIAIKCKIDKRLTMHVSRHSFADIARKKKISTQVISELLGHSSIAITQAYFGSGFDDDTLDDAMKEIID